MEVISIVAEVNGTYHFNVRSLQKGASAGRYEVRIDDLLHGLVVQSGNDASIAVAASPDFADQGVLVAIGGAVVLLFIVGMMRRA
mgnify:CR=1 FL=1